MRRIVLLLVPIVIAVMVATTAVRAEKKGKMMAPPPDILMALKNMTKMMPMMMQDKEMAMGYMAKKQTAAVERGKKLFEDPKLAKGTMGVNCASCHPGGQTTGGMAHVPQMAGMGPFDMPIPTLVGAAARFPKYKVPNDEVITLADMSNNCIRMFMGGQRLPLESQSMRDLVAYVTTLSEGETVAPGK